MVFKFAFCTTSVLSLWLQVASPDGFGLIDQARQLTFTVAALIAVAVLWRKIQSVDAKKDTQIETSTKAQVENTAATNRLADKICDLVDKIDDINKR